MANVEDLSDEEMAEEIMTWAGRIAAGQAHLLALIGAFDRREAWAGIGMLSCAHWLSLRLGMGLKAAHERVRVARALPGLPMTAEAFMAGRLSWTQVRAITRVANAGDELTYVELARHASGAQLERLVRGVRRAQKIVEDEADPEAAAYRMRTRVSYDADGTMVLSVRMPAEQGALVLAALEQARAELDQHCRQSAESSAEDSTPVYGFSSAEDSKAAAAAADGSAQDDPPGRNDRPVPATLTDAVMHLTRTFLEITADQRPDVSRRHRSRLVAHIDPISGWARLHDGELLPPNSTTALTAADLGRTQRLPDLALRELLGALDGERCRFPGCTRRRKLHAHHVTYWSDGGTTDLANLVLVCSRHHTLIHRQGFQLRLRPDRSLSVSTVDGVPVLHHPALPSQPAEHLDPDRTITPTTLPPALSGQRLELGYAVAVLMRQAA